MRVLTVGNMYPPHSFGGYELVWRSAVEHLREQGHVVRVLTTDTDTGTVAPDGEDVHRELRWRLRDGEFEAQGLRERAMLARHNHRVLERHLDGLRPDVVGWWSMGGLSLTMLESVRRRGVRAVAFVHDDWLAYGRQVDDWLRTFSGPRRERLTPMAERVAGVPASVDFDGAAEYVFVSDFTRRRARGLGLGLRRTAVAHSGIHPEFLAPAPVRDWSWDLLYVGRLDPRKGVDTAVRALSELPETATLTIAGGWDRREERRLRGLADELRVGDRVVFAGQLERPQLLEAYAAADAVAFPVRWDEPWGLVPLEAMARGRPVVATGRGGSAEYLSAGENALLFDAEDPAALAAALRRLATEPELREHLRAAGLATAARHTEPVFNLAVEAAMLGRRIDGASAGERPLRVLHLGTGFRPWRRGGLVAYAEDLMDEQVRRGDEVTYLFAGRMYPRLGGPRLKRWRRGGVTMLEIVNSPLHDHGFQPALELEEPRVEQIVQRVIAELRPDVVHVQELAGLPSSVLDVARRAGVATVMTLQDYFALCPTFKLLDATGRTCVRREVGAECVAAVAADPRRPGLLHEATVHHLLRESRLFLLVGPERREAVVERLVRWSLPRTIRSGEHRDAALYQRRRDANVERLNQADRLIAMSSRVAELHAELGVEPRRMETMQLTLSHIERLRPRKASGGGSLVFATLGGGESEAKGVRVLLDAARRLEDLATVGGFRLLILGTVAPEFAAEARLLPGVELPGRYLPEDQDAVLDAVDVGIMPSMWEEAYGYAGVEFLAKGIPVIANAIGGMVDYVREGETGWLNHSCSAAGLEQIMRDLVERPGQVAELNAWLIANRGAIVMPMARHADAMDAVYRDVIGSRS